MYVINSARRAGARDHDRGVTQQMQGYCLQSGGRGPHLLDAMR